jgi:hypothetical protein
MGCAANATRLHASLWRDVCVFWSEGVTVLALLSAAFRRSTLASHIRKIIGLRADKEVCRVHAQTVVARMADYGAAFGHLTVREKPSDPMSQSHAGRRSLRSEREISIAVSEHSADPHPAPALGLLNLGPKTLMGGRALSIHLLALGSSPVLRLTGNREHPPGSHAERHCYGADMLSPRRAATVLPVLIGRARHAHLLGHRLKTERMFVPQFFKSNGCRRNQPRAGNYFEFLRDLRGCWLACLHATKDSKSVAVAQDANLIGKDAMGDSPLLMLSLGDR